MLETRTRRGTTVPAFALHRLVRATDRGKSKLPAAGASGDWQDGGAKIGLSLVRTDNTQLCEVSGLTEGEARFLGDTILRERAEWFRGSGGRRQQF